MKILGVGFGLAISIGNTIAAGIVRTPGEIAEILPAPWLFISVWLVGGMYALLGAVVMAELGTMVPRSGGQYVFARRAIGPYAGFVVGWSDWISTCGTNAAVSIVIGEYSNTLLARFFSVPEKALEVPIAAGVVLFFALLNWRGIRSGSHTQNLTSLLKALIFIAVVMTCFLFGRKSEVLSAPVAARALEFALFIAFMKALQSVMYTYDGWTGPIYFSEEIENGEKSIPRAMIGGALGIVGIYALFNLALLYLLPLDKIAGEKFAMGAAMSQIFGPTGDTISRALMIVCLLSGINAYVLMTSRVLFAMSRDGLFVERASRVNAGGTPTFSLFLSTVVALAFLLTNTFEQVIAICAFFFVAQQCASFLSVFILRHREPEAPRPYRVWGHPFTTALALLGSIGYLSGVVMTDWSTSKISLAILALSFPAYWLTRKLTALKPTH